MTEDENQLGAAGNSAEEAAADDFFIVPAHENEAVFIQVTAEVIRQLCGYRSFCIIAEPAVILGEVFCPHSDELGDIFCSGFFKLHNVLLCDIRFQRSSWR